MLKHLIRRAARRLRPEWVRSVWRYADLDTLAVPPVLDLPAGRRLLVLAPHPDDESIGCGGMIAKWIAAGRAAQIVILTDGCGGGASVPGGKSDLSDIRRLEARAAVFELGGPELCFLGFADGLLSRNVAQAGARIAELLSDYSPDVVALPFPTDRHPDHTAVSPALVDAISRVAKAAHPQLILGYEVWSPLPANALIDIDGVRVQKIRAIEAHKSQTKQRNYAEASLALNRYRGETSLTGVQHAEAFWMGTPEQFLRLWSAVRV